MFRHSRRDEVPQVVGGVDVVHFLPIDGERVDLVLGRVEHKALDLGAVVLDLLPNGPRHEVIEPLLGKQSVAFVLLASHQLRRRRSVLRIGQKDAELTLPGAQLLIGLLGKNFQPENVTLQGTNPVLGRVQGTLKKKRK